MSLVKLIETSHLIDWSKCHNGLMLCTLEQAHELMPEVMPIIDPIKHLLLHYAIDVKVHKLMPGQNPSIPNWHYDFRPRDPLNRPSKYIKDETPMYLWVSGAPLTEFKDDTVLPNTWYMFNRDDLHRGVEATDFCWRGFIRAIPKSFIHPGTKNVGEVRRHSQVYIKNYDGFTW